MSMAFVRGISRWQVNSPHKGPVTREMFPSDDVIMILVINAHYLFAIVHSIPLPYDIPCSMSMYGHFAENDKPPWNMTAVFRFGNSVCGHGYLDSLNCGYVTSDHNECELPLVLAPPPTLAPHLHYIQRFTTQYLAVNLQLSSAVWYKSLLLYKYCDLSVLSDREQASFPGYMSRALISFDRITITHLINERWPEKMHWHANISIMNAVLSKRII